MVSDSAAGRKTPPPDTPLPAAAGDPTVAEGAPSADHSPAQLSTDPFRDDGAPRPTPGDGRSHDALLSSDLGAAQPAPALPPQREALRGLLPGPVLAAAARRARALGIGGDEVLIASGHLDARTAAAALADHLELAIDPLAAPPALPSALVPAALRTGIVVTPPGGVSPDGVSPEGAPGYIAAASGRAMRRLARAIGRDRSLKGRVRLASGPDLRGWLQRHGADHLAQGAAFALKDARPDLSAGTLRPAHLVRMAVAVLGALILVALALDAVAALLVVEIVLAVVFLCAMGLRLAACLVPPPEPLACAMSERELPLYSVIVPLYREAAVLGRLERALRALDYPPEKLDIKLVVEADDGETRAALAARCLPPWFEVVVAPPLGPRTKPKALNAALPLARGAFVAIFDAEDVPDPGQLKEALAAFHRGGPKVACVQAHLAVDNAADGWISAHFAAEYATHFDVFVPALAAFGLPILLGGTSNHFRRAVLEQAGAWDPYNVTEDADLGLRLSRAGWRTEVIASTTQEEAPITVPAWLRQRTRWMKGWAQTALVHGRHPLRFVRELGPYRAMGAALLVLVPFAATLLFPLSLGMVLYQAGAGILGYPAPGLAHAVAAAVSHGALVFGYGGMAAVYWEGWRRRPLGPIVPILVTLPAYWLLQTIAAWRALHELVRDPYRWDKTEHGVSGRSRADGAGPPPEGIGFASPARPATAQK